MVSWTYSCGREGWRWRRRRRSSSVSSVSPASWRRHCASAWARGDRRMDREGLKLELKQMIVRECQKDVPPEQLADGAILIGSESQLQLDSLDALQIALAVKQRYGK